MTISVNFETVNPLHQNELEVSNAILNHIPRKGESIVIGKACYLINDILWYLSGAVTFYLIRRNHPLP